MSKISHYQKLDDLILARIAAGEGVSFTSLHVSKAVFDESLRLGGALGRKGYRVVDGRLQALRRKGAIAYITKTGWVKAAPGQGQP